MNDKNAECRYLIASSQPWNEPMANSLQKRLGAPFCYISRKEDLTLELLRKLKPSQIFFPHWSFLIPESIYLNSECIVFHMTDLPFGRGGSPLQNLIAQGIRETKITALRAEQELDAGAIYLKRELSLSGRARDIFARSAKIIEDMIEEIISKKITPIPQSGEPVYFTRRKPAQSNISGVTDLISLYDHIRMLDAEGYPHAFGEVGEWRLEFTNAALGADSVEANVKIFRKDKKT